MSTFKGVAKEFPHIRIDYFRSVSGQPPPLAGFLSHVHSDHLAGLEAKNGYFVYCSPATKEASLSSSAHPHSTLHPKSQARIIETQTHRYSMLMRVQILIRLEKFPHRMNLAQGILECRKQTYKHLEPRLRTIPYETPTLIELSAGETIRVTLFDANHCAGSSMFLIEGDGKAILYTGDIRSEVWWVNSLVQNPVLLPYSLGAKRLDTIYLDTTFASKRDPYREFPSKAEGLRELIEKVSKYPADTTFYIESWTFGYENVWVAISALLSTPIHLDRYRWEIYKSLARTRGTPECREAAQLVGFQLGNARGGGCLTSSTKTRIHSCERGSGCAVVDHSPNVVRIVPIITRMSNGDEMHEMGIGGGKGDLDHINELDISDSSTLVTLMHHCATRIANRDDLLRVNAFLLKTCQRSQRLELEEEKMSLDELVDMLVRVSASAAENTQQENAVNAAVTDRTPLPKTITFPYSRHSSYSELCALVKAFQPRDVYACTVDEQTWAPDVSMEALFGHLCSDKIFGHDLEMMELCSRNQQRASNASQSQQHRDTQRTESQESQDQFTQITTIHRPTSPKSDFAVVNSPIPQTTIPQSSPYHTAPTTTPQRKKAPAASKTFNMPSSPLHTSPPLLGPHKSLQLPSSRTSINIISPPTKRRKTTDHHPSRTSATSRTAETQNQQAHHHPCPHALEISRLEEGETPGKRPRSIKTWAFHAARGSNPDVNSWHEFGGLSCVKKGEVEEEL
ncbi:beta-lactamase-like protein [Venturia nashicola]|uniref:Protein artemis n=1 Tax=Venturia nashicola TaxID=86259 RepID=A0A4Z1PET5_9PEZI|nr:beta-lactamase-like protein [Venturia nashicola]